MEKGFSLADVKAVAVDLSYANADTKEKFVLKSHKSVSFHIQMTAPDQTALEELQAQNTKQEVFYAYNNPSWYSLTTDTNTASTVIGNSVKVELCKKETLEIVKQFPENAEIPDDQKNTSFEFTLSLKADDDKRKAFSHREYQLWTLDANGEWQQDTSRLYATDSNGNLELCAGQKAVFVGIGQAEEIVAEEEESPYWKVNRYDSTDEETATRTLTFENVFRPILYVQKKVQALQDGMKAADQKFTFQILAGEEPVRNTEFWYVKSIRTDGGIPTKIGTGMTDENGEVTIGGGEMIALPVGEPGMSYTVKELPASDWICAQDTISGTLATRGNKAVFTNTYKYKNLLLTKKITRQDAKDCTQVFTFRICEVTEETDENGDPVLKPLSGNTWEIVGGTDAAGNSGSGKTYGTLDENGEFSCALAGKTVKIKDLEAKKTYLVEETESGKYYENVEKSPIEVTMPLYSTSSSISMTNEWLKRSLTVSKTLVYDATQAVNADAEDREFTMTAYVASDEEADLGQLKVLANYPYTVMKAGSVVREDCTTDANGSFQIKNGEKAVFADVAVAGTAFRVVETNDDDYPQIYPAAEDGTGAPIEGTIEEEGSEVGFINGEKGSLMIRKNYVAASGDEKAAALAARLNTEDAVSLTKGSQDVTISMTVTYQDDSGTWTEKWPRTSRSVKVMDQRDQSISTIWWYQYSTTTLKPYQTIIITGSQLLDRGDGTDPEDSNLSAVSYELTEAEENQNSIMIVSGSEDLYEVRQKDPADNASIKGSPDEKPVAILTNEISTLGCESTIEKRMTLGSTDVSVGAQLTWRVERYDGTKWKSAEGIRYVVYDDEGLVSDRVQQSGEDGEIVLLKTENGYPTVCFPEDKVWLNLDENAQKGDLRVVEDPADSDSTWGTLVGYGAADHIFDYRMDMDPAQAVAFMNSNQFSTVEVEKKLEGTSEETFAMILKQVTQTSTSADGGTQVEASEAYSGLTYTVYDTETGEQVGSGTTDTQGRIYLKGGQYASMSLPNGTLWTVEEELKPDYQLTELSGSNSDRLTALDDNLMLLSPGEDVTPESMSVTSPITFAKANVISDSGIYRLDGTLLQLDENGHLDIPEYVIYKRKKREVIQIKDSAFKDFTELKSVTLPDTLTMIYNNAFSGCTNLESVEIPNTVTVIGSNAFKNCSSLRSVTLPGKLSTIYSSVFAGCSSLENVTIPDTVTSIGSSAFSGCTSLATVTTSSGTKLKTIGTSAFSGCTSLTKFVLPIATTSIGASAFEGCTSLTALTIYTSAKLTSIGAYAFRGCTSLTGYTVSAKVTTVGEEAFRGCTAMTYLKIRNGAIGKNAFADCTSLDTVIWDTSMTTDTSKMSIGDYAFANSKMPETLKVADGVKSVGTYAFYKCPNLKTVTLPTSVTSIGSSAFEECSNLTSVTIPEGVTTISRRTFYNCTNLESVTIPSTITIIYEYAFYNCQKLASVTLPEGLTRLMTTVFYNCSSLTSVTIPSTVTNIGSYVFQNCTGLTSVTLPEGLTAIGDAAFNNCTSLTGVTIPSGVTSLNNSVFSGCSALTSVTIQDGVTTIKMYTFAGCTKLASVTIPSSVTSISSYAFSNCTGLTSICVAGKTENQISGSPWGASKATVTWG
jgi:hypothetical protein